MTTEVFLLFRIVVLTQVVLLHAGKNRKAKAQVERLDKQIEKLRADPNKSAELAAKQLERNNTVYKLNGDNLLDIKDQIKNTEQSIAQDATGDTSDLEARLSTWCGKEKVINRCSYRRNGI